MTTKNNQKIALTHKCPLSKFPSRPLSISSPLSKLIQKEFSASRREPASLGSSVFWTGPPGNYAALSTTSVETLTRRKRSWRRDGRVPARPGAATARARSSAPRPSSAPNPRPAQPPHGTHSQILGNLIDYFSVFSFLQQKTVQRF